MSEGSGARQCAALPNLNTHLHALVLDGVYREAQSAAEDSAPEFIETAAPSKQRLQTLLDKIIKRIMRLLTNLDHLIEEDGIVYLARTDSTDPDNILAPLQAASSTWRIAAGPRACFAPCLPGRKKCN